MATGGSDEDEIEHVKIERIEPDHDDDGVATFEVTYSRRIHARSVAEAIDMFRRVVQLDERPNFLITRPGDPLETYYAPDGEPM